MCGLRTHGPGGPQSYVRHTEVVAKVRVLVLYDPVRPVYDAHNLHVRRIVVAACDLRLTGRVRRGALRTAGRPALSGGGDATDLVHQDLGAVCRLKGDDGAVRADHLADQADLLPDQVFQHRAVHPGSGLR
eukprot:scaffold536_cov409-Prasinococcus_capsulatus_cf.AAC.2